MIGLNKQKKANGKYSKTETPSTFAINTPHILQGTSGLITVPASSNVRDKAFLERPTFSYIPLKVSPVKRIERYCSPIKTFTPIAVSAVDKIVVLTLLILS